MVAKKIAVILLLILLLTDCERSFEPIFPDLPEKLVLYGNLDLKNGLTVQVSKTGSTKKSIYLDTLLIRDAEVYLFDSLQTTTYKINHLLNGEYKKSDLSLNTSSKYKIIVHWKGQSTESEFLNIPALPDRLKLDRISFSRNIKTNKVENLKYSVQFLETEKLRFYLLGLYTNHEYRAGRHPDNYECTTNGALISTKCISNPNVKWEFDLSQFPLYNFLDTVQNPGNFLFSFTAYSLSYYIYTLSLIKPEAIEKFYIEPNLNYTNIKNGYGLFYTSNRLTDTIPIK